MYGKERKEKLKTPLYVVKFKLFDDENPDGLNEAKSKEIKERRKTPHSFFFLFWTFIMRILNIDYFFVFLMLKWIRIVNNSANKKIFIFFLEPDGSTHTKDDPLKGAVAFFSVLYFIFLSSFS